MTESKERHYKPGFVLEFFDRDKPIVNFQTGEPVPFFSMNVARARLIVKHFDEIQRFAEDHRDL